jgi:starch synthase (maltosyl-transferring)
LILGWNCFADSEFNNTDFEKTLFSVRHVISQANLMDKNLPANRGTALCASSSVLLPSVRILIEKIYPEIDCGRYPVKRVVGDRCDVWADIYRDGHELLRANLLCRRADSATWSSVPMRLHGNDRWVGTFDLTESTQYRYTIEAWTDVFGSWQERIVRKRAAGQDLALDLLEGEQMVLAATTLAQRKLAHASTDLEALLSGEMTTFMQEWGPRADVTRLDRELEVVVDRKEARFASWYEIFPRSQGTIAGRSASFNDCIARLDDIAAMGFDTVYLVPIHPIGEKNRKGRNNAVVASSDDPGSPYAIGSKLGGHDAVHPDLGTLDDFRAFVLACRNRGMEVALDLAVQCAPDHPWISQHPEWFAFRADGSIRYAENPPKQYQDIVNLNFDTTAAPAIWKAIRGIVDFWIAQGVSVFRVDNPHTKPFSFWEWLIREVQSEHAGVIFLSEAFTRPKLMRGLAKLGFTQSYTYFTWRNNKRELTEYFTELTREELREYFRPHLFTNTPDILPRFLQEGGPPAFRIRAVLAATLAGLFGIYNGFELCENRALPNSEEYLDSEKYQYKVWDWDRPGNIKSLIGALNRIRRENSVFEDWLNLEFLDCDNERVIFYTRGRRVFIAVSLDPYFAQETTIELPLAALQIAEHQDFMATNLLTGALMHWVGPRQKIHLEPNAPALIVAIRTAL